MLGPGLCGAADYRIQKCSQRFVDVPMLVPDFGKQRETAAVTQRPISALQSAMQATLQQARPRQGRSSEMTVSGACGQPLRADRERRSDVGARASSGRERCLAAAEMAAGGAALMESRGTAAGTRRTNGQA